MTWFKAMFAHRWSPFRRNRVRKIVAETSSTEFSSLHDVACTTTAAQRRQNDFIQRESGQVDPSPRDRPGRVEAQDDSDDESIASTIDMTDPQVRERCETLMFIPDAEEYMDAEEVRRYREECGLGAGDA
eukprot:TRINITY_DN5244_c0_g1_i2.p1 TRINITY_DN5244_c0_g1~~TRINITY_DN5244_c0_g1_i2.p1  ORF type:complete len:130 (-),score=24.03 TRINITY_DN5244_c0_g1_i2:698-1087(-)